MSMLCPQFACPCKLWNAFILYTGKKKRKLSYSCLKLCYGLYEHNNILMNSLMNVLQWQNNEGYFPLSQLPSKIFYSLFIAFEIIYLWFIFWGFKNSIFHWFMINVFLFKAVLAVLFTFHYDPIYCHSKIPHKYRDSSVWSGLIWPLYNYSRIYYLPNQVTNKKLVTLLSLIRLN